MGKSSSKLLGKQSILMLGLDNAGKTTTFLQLKTQLESEGIEVTPTIGINTELIVYNKIKLNVVDMGGREESRGLWTAYYTNASAVVFLIDSGDQNRFEECKGVIHKMANDVNLANAVFLFLANKQDLDNATPFNELSTALELTSIAQKWNIFGISAKDAIGIADAFDWLIDTLKEVKEIKREKKTK